MSLAVERCPSHGSPLQFLNVVFFIPNSWHLLFIMFTKSSSVPPRYSAKATAASLPDAIATPFNNSSTVLTSPVSSNIVLPPIFLAFSLHVTLSSNLILPLSTASIVNSIVIIFVTEAGANFSSMLFSYRTFPEIGSISKNDFASILFTPPPLDSSSSLALVNIPTGNNKIDSIIINDRDICLIIFLFIYLPPFKNIVSK